LMFIDFYWCLLFIVFYCLSLIFIDVYGCLLISIGVY